MSRPLPGPGCGPLAAAQYLVDYAMECEGLGLPITAAGLAECLATVSKSIGGPLPPL